jgi:matrix metalloproteinase-14 (membrane-inserted)
MRRRDFIAGVGNVAAWSLVARSGRVDAQPLPPLLYSRGYRPLPASALRSLPTAESNRMVLPVSVDLSGRMPLPGDQGAIGSCIAWATSYARTFYVAQYEGRDPRHPANIVSPNYLYLLARPNACDDGRNWSEVVAILKKGALSIADYPYSQACATPPANKVVTATDFQTLGLRIVDMKKTEDIKGQIARGNPVLFSFNATGAFDNFRGDGTYTQPLRNPDAGGHGVVLVGYDDVRQAFRLLNSWGQHWGDRGYAWIAYETVREQANSGLVLIVAEPKRPVAFVRPNAALVSAYFFKGGQYVRYDVGADKVVDGALPLDGRHWENWPQAWNSGINAAVDFGNGNAYFFKGSQYLRYDIPGQRVDDGYPRPIAGNWQGFPASWNSGFDAAINWGNGKIYFFKGGEYLRYDIAKDKVDDGYPRPLNDTTWPHWPVAWNSGINAAVNWGNGKAYFFKGEQYLRYDIAADTVDHDYPRPIAGNWPGLMEALSRRVDAAIAAPGL